MSNFDDGFFFSGGKFSDWSGSSAGKFDDDVFGGSSGISSAGVYLSPSERARLSEEKSHGLPQYATALPSFLGCWGLAQRGALLLIVMLIALIGPYVYLHQDDGEAYFVAGAWTVFFTAFWVTFVSMTRNWYPKPHGITTERLVRFTMVVQGMVAGSAIFMIAVITTPLWGPWTDDFCYAHQGMLMRELLHPIGHHIYWYHWTFAPLLACIPLVYLIISIVTMVRRKDLQGILRYLQYKDDTLTQEAKARLEKMAELRKQIDMKQSELQKLYRKLKELEASEAMLRNYKL